MSGLAGVLTGPGGVGKSRLALKIAAEFAAGGGEQVLVAAGEDARALAAVRAVTSGRVLLVVDYAETRAGLPGLLRAVLADPGPVRVLLIARSLGEWWDRLSEESAPAVAGLLAGVAPVTLDARVSEDYSDADLVAAAAPDIARALGVPVPGRVVAELGRCRSLRRRSRCAVSWPP